MSLMVRPLFSACWNLGVSRVGCSSLVRSKTIVFPMIPNPQDFCRWNSGRLFRYPKGEAVLSKESKGTGGSQKHQEASKGEGKREKKASLFGSDFEKEMIISLFFLSLGCLSRTLFEKCIGLDDKHPCEATRPTQCEAGHPTQ